MKNSDLNTLRRMAGLSPLMEKNGHFDEPVVGDKEEKKDENEGKDKEDEPSYPEVVTAMAAKMEGKTGDELVELVSKLYQAGVDDGVAKAKAEAEGKEEKGEKEEPAVSEAFDKLVPSKYYVHYKSGVIIAGPLDLEDAKAKAKEYTDGGEEGKDVTYSLGSALIADRNNVTESEEIKRLRRLINY